MKITSHTSLSPKMSLKSEQDFKKNIQGNSKNIQDALKINNSAFKNDVKEINKAIGSLQIVIKSLQKLEDQAQVAQVDFRQENLISFKKEADNILTSAKLDKENVFDMDYKKLSKNINIDLSSFKHKISTIHNSKDIKQFMQTLKNQQNQTKQAIVVLQNKLNNNLITDNKDYNQLNINFLPAENFKNAHDTTYLSIERVSKLLA